MPIPKFPEGLVYSGYTIKDGVSGVLTVTAEKERFGEWEGFKSISSETLSDDKQPSS